MKLIVAVAVQLRTNVPIEPAVVCVTNVDDEF